MIPANMPLTREDPALPDTLAPLLTCGHYGMPIFERSSQWDFPEDPMTCPVCGKERQMNLLLQVSLMREWFEGDDD